MLLLILFVKNKDGLIFVLNSIIIYEMNIGIIHVSIIKSKPKGRKPVITKMLLDKDIMVALKTSYDALKDGHQVYVVAPLVEENEEEKENSLEDVKRLQEELGEEYYIVMKMHPHLDAKHKLSNCDIPTERILPIADMLIADYSSVIFDYTLYQKPIVLFVPDYDEFVSTRGLYIDLNEIPGQMVKDGTDLKEAVLREFIEFNRDEYRAFYEDYMGACDGKATKRIIDEISAKI